MKTLVSDLKGKGISVVKNNYRNSYDTFSKCKGKDCQKIFCKCRVKTDERST